MYLKLTWVALNSCDTSIFKTFFDLLLNTCKTSRFKESTCFDSRHDVYGSLQRQSGSKTETRRQGHVRDCCKQERLPHTSLDKKGSRHTFAKSLKGPDKSLVVFLLWVQPTNVIDRCIHFIFLSCKKKM